MSFATKPSRQFLPFPAALAIAGVICLTVAAVFTLSNLENQNATASFNIVAQERFDAVETNVALTLHSLVSLGALHDHADRIERREFARFAKDLRQQDSAIQALEWLPRTPKRLRANRENAAHRDGSPTFQFTERLPQGQLARAGDRDEYFPVFFVEPLEGNEKALGFDLASDPVRNEALWRSVATGSLVATGRVSLVQGTGDQYGLLVFRPVYRGGVTPSNARERRELLTGCALAVFRIGDMIEKTRAAADRGFGLQVAIFDLDAEPGARILYPKNARFDGVEDVPGGIRAMREIRVAGRKWAIAAYPDPQAFQPMRRSSESALAGGLLLTILLASYLRLNHRWQLEIEQGRERLEELVKLRTDDLEAGASPPAPTPQPIGKVS